MESGPAVAEFASQTPFGCWSDQDRQRGRLSTWQRGRSQTPFGCWSDQDWPMWREYSRQWRWSHKRLSAVGPIRTIVLAALIRVESAVTNAFRLLVRSGHQSRRRGLSQLQGRHKRLSAVGPIRTCGIDVQRLCEGAEVTNAFRLLVRSGLGTSSQHNRRARSARHKRLSAVGPIRTRR